MTVYEYAMVRKNHKSGKWEAETETKSAEFERKMEAFNYLGIRQFKHYDTNSIGEYFFIKEVQHDIG